MENGCGVHAKNIRSQTHKSCISSAQYPDVQAIYYGSAYTENPPSTTTSAQSSQASFPYYESPPYSCAVAEVKVYPFIVPLAMQRYNNFGKKPLNPLLIFLSISPNNLSY